MMQAIMPAREGRELAVADGGLVTGRGAVRMESSGNTSDPFRKEADVCVTQLRCEIIPIRNVLYTKK
ncbi:MAG: hypothetical protein ETSY1_35035 [Candidatus Entotheonella factor]|uniref:Uncharacterized protein n=1 Tax=Entotheonella factor TaxID=1429438 RepID=W4L939_ENTF1|nr:MAG: hypothetical protein ETSY1_35035 [Candidatus Entotheonella factor]